MKTEYFNANNIDIVSKKIQQEISVFKKNTSQIFDINQSALLVLDMQNYFLGSTSNAFVPSSKAIIKNIKLLCDLFQNSNRPIIFSQHSNNKSNAMMMGIWWQKLLEKKSPYYEIIDELSQYDKLIINKTQYDAFYKTKLNSILKENKIKQVVVCGVMTHLCCETTIRSAFVRGYQTFFPIDSTATYNYEQHLSTFINLSHGFCTPILTQDIINDNKS